MDDPDVKRVFGKYAGVDNIMVLAELRPALAELGLSVSEGEATEILNSVDEDLSGSLQFAEFALLFQETQLRTVFARLDKDGSGSISASELRGAMQMLGYTVAVGEINTMVKRVDTSGDGSVDFAEFKAFFHLVPRASLDSIASRWVSLSSCDVGSDLSPPVPTPGAQLCTKHYLSGGLSGSVGFMHYSCTCNM
jgi:Ca2+-binding EF-hand superfamily protein